MELPAVSLRRFVFFIWAPNQQFALVSIGFARREVWKSPFALPTTKNWEEFYLVSQGSITRSLRGRAVSGDHGCWFKPLREGSASSRGVLGGLPVHLHCRPDSLDRGVQQIYSRPAATKTLAPRDRGAKRIGRDGFLGINPLMPGTARLEVFEGTALSGVQKGSQKSFCF